MEYNKRMPPKDCFICGHRATRVILIRHNERGYYCDQCYYGGYMRSDELIRSHKVVVVSLMKTGDRFPNQFEGRCDDGDHIYIRQRGYDLTVSKHPTEMGAVDLAQRFLICKVPMHGYFSISIEELEKFTSAWIDWDKLERET